jgi:hypothetical protein
MILLSGISSSCDATDPASFIEPLGDSVGLVVFIVAIATLGQLVVAAGWSIARDSMAGGSGALYVKVGVLLYVIGAAVAVVESGFFIGAAAASGRW